MKNWPLTPAIELCTFAVDCINKTAPSTLKKTPYKMIRTSNIRNGSINTSDVRYVTKETFERWTKRSRPAFGDVILTREAPVGEVGRVTFTEEDNIFLGQRLFHYRPDPKKTDWNYFAYALKSKEVQDRIHGKSFGSTVPHIKVGDAENLLIPTPPLSEQRKIGHILSSYDDLITTNQRRIALLEEAAHLIYREWFVHLRFPGHDSIEKKNGTPTGWTKKSLGDIAKLHYGKALKASERNPGKFPVYGSSGVVGYHNTPFVQAGAIIVGRKGNIGSLFYSDNPCFPIDTVFFIPPEQSSRWLYLALHSLNFISSDSAVPGLNRAYAESLPIMEPDIQTQERFKALTDPLFTKIEILQQQNHRLAQARDLLLPKLMSGQIDVSNIRLTDEDVVM